MILKSNTFNVSNLNLKEENNISNKETDDDLFLNEFNIQSSVFFNNHHLSSKSDDFEKFKKDYDINYDFFHFQSNLKESKTEKLQINLNKSFDFKTKKKRLTVKEEKNELNDPSSYLKMNNKANSAKIPQTKSNYILKSELNMMNNEKDCKEKNNFKNNMLFNYYSDNNNFTLRNRNIDNQSEKYLLDIIDDEKDVSLILDKDNSNNEEDDQNFNCENNNFIQINDNYNEEENEDNNIYFSPKDKSGNFTLNYINNNFNFDYC